MEFQEDEVAPSLRRKSPNYADMQCKWTHKEVESYM